MKKLIITLIMLTSGLFTTKPAYNFNLPDAKGKQVHLTDFKGKVAVIDFWFTGCINCMNFYHNSFSKAEKLFENNPDVVFVSICIDKNKATWLKSLDKGRYASKSCVNLFTQGKGDQHQVIKSYQVSTYPQPIIINRKGELVRRSEDLTKPEVLFNAINEILRN